MSKKQQIARANFKKAIKEAQALRKKNPKLTQSEALKKAFAANKKVGAYKVVEKSETKLTKPKATYQVVRAKKETFKGLKKIAGSNSQIAGMKLISGQHNVDSLNSAIKRKQMMEEIFLKSKLMPLKNRSEFDRTMIKKLPLIIKNEKSLISQFKKMIK